MINNKKLLGALVIVLSTSCGKSKFGKGTELGARDTSLVNPIDVSSNLSEDKDEVSSLVNGVDYSQGCSDEGVSCDGMWVLKQARCNGEVLKGSYKNEPVVINIKGDKSELQFENAKVESFSFAENTAGYLAFTKEDGTTLSKSYTTAISEGIMNVIHEANEQCAAGAQSIYTRVSPEVAAGLLQKADEVAAAKEKEKTDAEAASSLAEEEACKATQKEFDDAEKASGEPSIVSLDDGEC